MRLLYVISNCRVGGAENYTLRLATRIRQALQPERIDVLLTHGQGDLYKRYTATFNNTHQFWHESDKKACLERYVRNNHYDIIHSIDNYELIGSLSSRPNRIVQSVFLDATLPKHAPYLVMLRKLIPNVRALLTELPQNCTVLPCTQISNGVDTDFWTPDAMPEKRVCWVGRLTPQKGADILATIIQVNPHIAFSVIANEPNTDPGFLHADFLELAKKCGNLTYQWGLSPQKLREVYRASQVYLHTSTSEAQPGTLLEAMSCGCYPVCGAVGGVPEIVDGLGLLVRPVWDDMVAAYSGMLECAMHDVKPVDTRSRIVERYSIAANVAATARVYREVVESK